MSGQPRAVSLVRVTEVNSSVTTMRLHDAQGKRLYLTVEERSTRPSGAARGMPASRSGRGEQPSADYFGCGPAEGALTLDRARP